MKKLSLFPHGPTKLEYGLGFLALRGALLLQIVLMYVGCSVDVRADISDAPLLSKDDLVYLGAFRVPRKDINGNTFSYGGRALAFNPVNNSLFIMGHVKNQLTAEISIPQIIDSVRRDELKTAEFIQPFHDATNGRRHLIDPGDRNGIRIGGHLVHGDRLYVSAYAYYDANGSQDKSHFARPLSLATSGEVVGAVRVGDNAHYTSGYMLAATWVPYRLNGRRC